MRLLISECEGLKFRQTDLDDFTLDRSTWMKIWKIAETQRVAFGGKNRVHVEGISLT